MRLVMGLAFAASMGAIVSAHALVGASEDASAQDSAQVVMVLKRGGSYAGFCTGVVLARTIVLTAAHCVHGAEHLAINAGARGAPRVIAVKDAQTHPEFRADAIEKRVRSIDMALVRLPEPLPESFRPARLSTNVSAREGERFRILGYGLVREGDGASAGRLRAGELEARAPLSRILLWAKDPKAKGFGACTGDSGGPIFSSDGAAFAITTWSTGEGAKNCGAVTQAALVAPQRAWIDGAIAKWR